MMIAGIWVSPQRNEGLNSSLATDEIEYLAVRTWTCSADQRDWLFETDLPYVGDDHLPAHAVPGSRIPDVDL
jgi:hypothetical protein